MLGGQTLYGLIQNPKNWHLGRDPYYMKPICLECSPLVMCGTILRSDAPQQWEKAR